MSPPEIFKANRGLWTALAPERLQRSADSDPVEPEKPQTNSIGGFPSAGTNGDGGEEENSGESLLIEQARQDPAAFGVLYESYVDRIYAYFYHRVHNVQDAEDLTARTFYRALDNLDTYEDRGVPFSAWLFRIAHNLVANWHRDHSRRRFLSLDRLWSHSGDRETPEEHIEREERQAALLSAINRLPEERRNLLLFKFGTHLSNIEIGDLMNKSESAIKSLYFRTLATLRKDLEARGWDGSAPDDAASADSDTEPAPSSGAREDEPAAVVR